MRRKSNGFELSLRSGKGRYATRGTESLNGVVTGLRDVRHRVFTPLRAKFGGTRKKNCELIVRRQKDGERSLSDRESGRCASTVSHPTFFIFPWISKTGSKK
jgi:hypothetical protein